MIRGKMYRVYYVHISTNTIYYYKTHLIFHIQQARYGQYVHSTTYCLNFTVRTALPHILRQAKIELAVARKWRQRQREGVIKLLN